MSKMKKLYREFFGFVLKEDTSTPVTSFKIGDLNIQSETGFSDLKNGDIVKIRAQLATGLVEWKLNDETISKY